MIFRCTQRLLKGTKLPVSAEPPEPASVLDEWHVNVVPVPFAGRLIVLYTHTTALACVVAPGQALHTTLPTFRDHLTALLRRLELPNEWIGALRDLAETTVARTNNGRVLGSMAAQTLKGEPGPSHHNRDGPGFVRYKRSSAVLAVI